MTLSRLTLLALLLSACGDGAGPATEEKEMFDLRPVWRVGETIEVRVERVRRKGLGDLPPTGELAGRTRELEKAIDVMRIEVREAIGSTLLRTRRTCLASWVEKEGTREDTVVSGKTYEIEDPFGESRVSRVADGQVADEEEQEHLKRTGLLMAATLLPAEPVSVEDAWVPGRDASVLSKAGGGRIRMGCRLASVGREDQSRIARIEGRMEGQIGREGRPGARLAVQERLFLDLTAGRLRSYHSTSELYFPPPFSAKGRWERTEVVLTVDVR
jgi:hypothetical protein